MIRDPPDLGKRLFAVCYPRIVGLAENAGQRETRRELISQIGGAGHSRSAPAAA